MRCGRLVTVLLSIALSAGAHAASPEYAWAQAHLNGQQRGSVLIVRVPERDVIWLEQRTLQDWGLLDLASQVVREFDGTAFIALNSIRGLSAEWHDSEARLDVQVDATALPYQQLQAGSRRMAPAVATRSLGAHLNYDLLGAHQSDGKTSASAFFHLTAFGAFGSISNGLSWRDDALNGPSWLRLETSWNHDVLDRAWRIKLGDVTSASDAFGTRYRVAGVQWKKEFSIRPDELTFAPPVITGLADVPSQVELFINGVRRSRLQADPGPFEINEAPVLTGAGSAELRLTNVLGEQVVQQINYYVDPSLLRRGLWDFDLSAGWRRESFGVESFDYGAAQAQALIRHGVTDRATLEARAVLAERQHQAELRYVFQFLDWPLTVTTGAGAAQLQSGAYTPFGRVGLSWRWQRLFAGVQALSADIHTDDSSPLPLQRQVLARAGFNLGLWSVALDTLYRRRNANDRFERRNLRLSRAFRTGVGHFSVYAGAFHNSDSQAEDESGLYAGLSWSPQHTQRLALSARGGAQSQTYSSYQYRSPHDLGHQAEIHNLNDGGNTTWVGQYTGRYSQAQLRARAQTDRFGESLQAGVQGAIGLIEGRWFNARPLGASYALVRVQDHPGVPIYMHNRMVARTNARGLAIMPELLAYQSNEVRVDPLDLPLQNLIDDTGVRFTPSAFAGVLVDIPVSTDTGVELRLMRDPFSPVPAGAVIYRDGDDARFFVGSEGASYVEVRHAEEHFKAYWEGGQCHFRIARSQLRQELQPDLGALPCRP